MSKSQHSPKIYKCLIKHHKNQNSIMVLPTCDRAILSYSSASAWASLHGFPKCFRGELHHVVWVCDVRATCGGLSCFARILAIKTTVWRVLRSKRNIHITLISPCSSIVLAKKLFGASKCHNWFSIPVVTIRWQYATKNKINLSRALPKDSFILSLTSDLCIFKSLFSTQG